LFDQLRRQIIAYFKQKNALLYPKISIF